VEWEDRQESENVEDRRSQGRRTGVVLGGGAGLVVLLLAMFLGVNPAQLQQLLGPGGPLQVGAPQAGQAQAPPADPAEERLAHFTKVILHDTEEVWDDLFTRMGRHYEKPTLVLFSDEVDSACGMAESAMGPFYCPGDAKVYIDLSFYRDMQERLGAPGEFARAYVVAHEVGHHVQRLLGYSRQADRARQSGSQVAANRASVRIELQADYLAGVWAHHGQRKFNFLQPGDVDSALNAAFQIGDDRLRRKAGRRVVPDSFTHGSSEQRQRWFNEGFRTGKVEGASQLLERPYEDL
jgi:predicted metalloprotease